MWRRKSSNLFREWSQLWRHSWRGAFKYAPVCRANAVQEGQPDHITMIIPLVFVSIFCVGLGSAAEGIQYKAYALRTVSVTTEEIVLCYEKNFSFEGFKN